MCEIKKNASPTGTYCLPCDIVHVAEGATLAEWSEVCINAERIKNDALLDLILVAAIGPMARTWQVALNDYRNALASGNERGREVALHTIELHDRKLARALHDGAVKPIVERCVAVAEMALWGIVTPTECTDYACDICY